MHLWLLLFSCEEARTWRLCCQKTLSPQKKPSPHGVSILLLTYNTSNEACLHFSLVPDIFIMAIILLQVNYTELW